MKKLAQLLVDNKIAITARRTETGLVFEITPTEPELSDLYIAFKSDEGVSLDAFVELYLVPAINGINDGRKHPENIIG